MQLGFAITAASANETMEDRGGEKYVQRLNLNRRRIPRERGVQACQQCRLRKVKCDRTRPQCQQCGLHHRQCTYLPQNMPAAKNSRSSSQLASSAPSLEVDPGPERHTTSPTKDRPQFIYTPIAIKNFHLSDSSPSHYRAAERRPKPTEAELSLTRSFGSLWHQLEIDRLVSWYAKYCHFWFPHIDIPEVLALLQSMRVGKSISGGFPALLTAICYVAATSASAAAESQPTSSVPVAGWADIANQFLQAADYPRCPTLSTIRAAFLLAIQSIGEDTSVPQFGPICVLVRAAQHLGLHRDKNPTDFSRTATFNRALWWSIFVLDVSYAVAHGLPLLLHPTGYNVQGLTTEHDQVFSFINTTAKVNKLVSKVLLYIYGTHPLAASEMHLLDEEAEKLSNEEVRKSRHAQQSTQTTPLERFINLSQTMCCWKLLFLLHQPYLRSPRWLPNSRQKTLTSCRDFIDGYLTVIADPTLGPYRWVLNHFNVIHPCAILLQDLIQHPASEESGGLRRIVETCFDTLLKDSQADWGELDILRSRAWAVNGWTRDIIENPALDGSGTPSLSDWDPLFASFVWDWDWD